MINHCKIWQSRLEELKTKQQALRQDLTAATNPSNPAYGDFGNCQKIKGELKATVENLHKTIESDHLEKKFNLDFRFEVAKKIGAVYVGQFENGVAVAHFADPEKQGRLYDMLINREGSLVTEQKFDIIEEFKHGLAPVYKARADGKFLYNLLSRDGRLQLPEWSDKRVQYGENYICIQRGGTTPSNHERVYYLEPRDPKKANHFPDFRYKGIPSNWDGTLLSNPFRICGNGTILLNPGIPYNIEEGGFYVYNKNGEIISNEVIRPADPDFGFSEGLLPCHKWDDKFSNGEIYYFINELGQKILPAEWYFQDAAPFSDGLAAVKQRGRWYYINSSGKEPAGLKGKRFVEAPGPFINGIARIFENESRQFYIDKQGNRLFGTDFQEASDFNKDGYAVVKNDNTWQLIDRKGRQLIFLKDRKFNGEHFYEFNGIILEQAEGQLSFMDLKGRLLGKLPLA